jgi:hypothetical protein
MKFLLGETSLLRLSIIRCSFSIFAWVNRQKLERVPIDSNRGNPNNFLQLQV